MSHDTSGEAMAPLRDDGSGSPPASPHPPPPAKRADEARHFSPWRTLWTRYRDVAREAWQARHALAGPSRQDHETAFLPAALSLQETPPHPAPRRAMGLITGLCVCAALWSLLGEVDIVAVAPGRLVPSEGRQVVQALEVSTVRRVLVQEGQQVQAGQVLLELDPTLLTADTASLKAQLDSVTEEIERTMRLLAALSQGRLDVPGASPRASRSEQTAAADRSDAALPPRMAARTAAPPSFTDPAQAEWDDIQAQRARLAGETRRRAAELETARLTLTKLQALSPWTERREADTRALAGQGFVTDHVAQDRARERIELERDIATQQARVAEGEAALQTSRQAQTAYETQTRRALEDRLRQARHDQAQRSPQWAKGAHRERGTELRAPMDGQVQELAVRTPGAVVTPAQTLLVVVPEASRLQAEVMIDNKDIGHVQAGQRAAVKLEAFPFARYGTVPARVDSISADAVVGPDGAARFKALLTLEDVRWTVDDRPVRLGAGLNVVGEIQSGRRKLIRYLVDPLVVYRGEAMRER